LACYDRLGWKSNTFIQPSAKPDLSALPTRFIGRSHAPFAIGQTARDRWLQLMTRALDEAVLPDEPRQILQSFFESTTTFLQNRPGD
jgi:hypothetical protein